LQFQLKTDGGVTRDGWYLDDIGVFIYSIPTDISNDEEPINQFSLEQNYPNPFNPSTTIHYSIPSVALSGVERSVVTLRVYDVLGNEVAILVNEEKPAGNYEVEFNTSTIKHNSSSGIYFYQLKAGNFIRTRKMILLK